MFTKPTKSKAHKLLEILEKRTTLSVDQQRSLHRMSAGYNGELQFFKLLQNDLQCEPILLFDLLLEVNGSECQIDCLLIFQNELILIEIKNYQGDFFIDNNNWYTLSREEIKNPLYQLSRTELLLKQILKQHQLSISIKPFLVFIHPEFQLYQAPLNIPIIFPTQLKRFIQKLQNTPCRIHKHHQNIAQLLKSKHKITSSYETSHIYDYTHLRKGVTCGKCSGLMEMYESNDMCCPKCKSIVHFEQAIMGNVFDFHTLFPNEKITVKIISEWTNYPVSHYKIWKVLSKYLQSFNKGRSSYYLLNEDTSKSLGLLKEY